MTQLHVDERSLDPRQQRGTRIALVAIGAGFVAVLGAMIGALFLDASEESVGAARGPVRSACREARTALRELGAVDVDSTDQELADRVDTETSILRAMVAEIETADPGSDDGRTALRAWVSDWRRLLDARDSAADEIRAGERPSTWLPPEEPGAVKGIDGRMDEYALREGLAECTTTALEADNLDGQRLYPELDEE